MILLIHKVIKQIKQQHRGQTIMYLQKGQRITAKKAFGIEGKRTEEGQSWEVYISAREGANALMVRVGKKGKALSTNNFANMAGLHINELKRLIAGDFIEIA
jgi:ethanolamine ammonia-lyase large subunit